MAEGRFAVSPFICFRWLKAPGEVYGRSPVMKALPDIKTADKVVDGRLNAEWLRRYEEPIDYSEVNGRPVLRLAGRRLLSASAWLDPSCGRRDKGDACVLAAVFTDEDGRRLPHRVAHLHYDPKNDRDSAARQLCRQAAAHRRKLMLPVVRVESNGPGSWMPKILQRELMREGHGATVIGTPNSRPKHERILDAFDAPLAAGQPAPGLAALAAALLDRRKADRPAAPAE